MPLHLGPGPVFVHESIAATRRWQMYALRSLFVLGLLLALAAVLYMELGGFAASGSIRALAALGEGFYYAISGVQLVLVLLVAPAATAGAICVDRARGMLTHMMVTDLRDSEIVLGKLAARLLPVFAIVGATVPVLALAGLLGGIVIEAIAMLTLITFVVAVLGCALALAFSVRATKVHEVLMAVYGIEAVWIVGPLVWFILEEVGGLPAPPDWFFDINPFTLAWAPYASPNRIGIEFYALVLSSGLLLSAGLVAYAVLRLRAEATRGARSREKKPFSWVSRACAWAQARRPGPSLDDDPVLWREWRRGRPTRLARIIWGFYIAVALAGTGWSVMMASVGAEDIVGIVSGFQATFGLLLVSITAPTALAEERARGSLDVLMTTPLPTDRIVLAKWWGAYRIVPALALLPAIGSLIVGFAEPQIAPGAFTSRAHAVDPVGWVDRVAFVCLPTALMLAQGAVVTSFGLALATWMRRVGRAIAASVACYAFVAFAWLVLLEAGVVTELLAWLGAFGRYDQDASQFYALIGASISPLGAQIAPFQSVSRAEALSRYAFYIGHVIVLLFTIGAALLFLGLTLATFNRSMGRMPERARRAPRPPRRALAARGPHTTKTGSRGAVLAQLNG
jgi:ABC-type transport system involved in multi-copper enzyme maturation permease subunit